MKDEQDKGIKKTCRSGYTGLNILLQGFNYYEVWILDFLQIVYVLHRTGKYSVKVL